MIALMDNRRRDVISLNQPRGMSAKMAANPRLLFSNLIWKSLSLVKRAAYLTV